MRPALGLTLNIIRDLKVKQVMVGKNWEETKRYKKMGTG